MFQKKNADPSLAEELPYWDFSELPRPHAILQDGSLVGGIKLSLIDIECFDENEINQLNLKLRGALNSVSEGVTLQFCLSVKSDYSDVIDKHIKGKTPNIHPLVAGIAEFRERKLTAALESSELYRPELSVYLRTKMVAAKKSGFLKKKEDFSDKAVESYQETLEVLFQNIDTLISTFASIGLQGKILTKEEIISQVYMHLNPKRSKVEPTPKVVTMVEDDLEKETIDEMNWLAAQSPREQLAFGDLILGFDQFTLDSHYHRVITLKTLPEATFAGQLANFLRMPFHYDLIVSLDVPPQADEMSKLQQKRKMAHSLAVTSGNKASDLESETKLSSTEELIRELLNTGQRIYVSAPGTRRRCACSPTRHFALASQTRQGLTSKTS
jgi:hypothetical protein